MKHRDPPQTVHGAARAHTNLVPETRYYRVRWLDCPPNSDTWEPRATLLAEVPYILSEYEREVSEIEGFEQLEILENRSSRMSRRSQCRKPRRLRKSSWSQCIVLTHAHVCSSPPIARWCSLCTPNSRAILLGNWTIAKRSSIERGLAALQRCAHNDGNILACL